MEKKEVNKMEHDGKLMSTMDVVFVIDCSLSMYRFLKKIRRVLMKKFMKIARKHKNMFRFGLIRFQSSDLHRAQTIPLMSDINGFLKSMMGDSLNATDIGTSMTMGQALSEALAFEWRSNYTANTIHDIFHNNLIILLTNNPPSGLFDEFSPSDAQDVWKIADKLNEQNICLTTVGFEPEINVCSDFYCALSNKTGGEYIPFVNATKVLLAVIHHVLSEESTFAQSFRHLSVGSDIQANSSYNYNENYERVRYMISHCSSMYEIRKACYNYLKTNRYDQIHNDNYEYSGLNEDFGLGNSLSIEYFHQGWGIVPPRLLISPPTSDEGYRSRLLTDGSYNDDTVNGISSPWSFQSAEHDMLSDIENTFF